MVILISGINYFLTGSWHNFLPSLLRPPCGVCLESADLLLVITSHIASTISSQLFYWCKLPLPSVSFIPDIFIGAIFHL
ncbi:hypothetical protein L1987_39488 [Smallanthus sonchifolius]|uniref:Uncharacterized protein n=1 Tax=Smallanthus sonchifolius TaxID=185202 RepID=A0ACB9HMF4_9ASTR|nr:hypothetical protein L1987_39488 [Smallanthus sonchifolius]